MAEKSSVNRVILLDNLGADPEVQETQAGVSVATVSLATNEVFMDKDGNKNQETEWHRVVLWRQLAKAAGAYLKKGSKVYVEGRLKTRSWEDKEGITRNVTEVIAERLTMLDSKEGDQKEPPAVDTPLPEEAAEEEK